MHYTAMAGLSLYPHDLAPSTGPALSPDLLAIVVAIVAFVVSGIFLLILVPDRSLQPAAATAYCMSARRQSCADLAIMSCLQLSAMDGPML